MENTACKRFALEECIDHERSFCLAAITENAKELMPNLSPLQALSKARRLNPLQLLPQFSVKFPSQLKVLELLRLSPKPAANKLCQKQQSYSNIGHHSLAAAFLAELIANKLSGAGLLACNEVKDITAKALLHDCLKPHEIASTSKGKTTLLPHQAWGKHLLKLKHAGTPDIVLQQIKAGCLETGHHALRQYLTVTSRTSCRLKKGCLGAKIIFLADCMTYTSIPQANEPPLTAFLSPWERMVAGQHAMRYPYLFKAGLGISITGKLIPAKDISHKSLGFMPIGTYAELQVLVSHLINLEIQSLLGYKDPTRSFGWIIEAV